MKKLKPPTTPGDGYRFIKKGERAIVNDEVWDSQVGWAFFPALGVELRKDPHYQDADLPARRAVSYGKDKFMEDHLHTHPEEAEELRRRKVGANGKDIYPLKPKGKTHA